MTLSISALRHPQLHQWLKEVVDLCKPDHLHICDGSQEEADLLSHQLVEKGAFIALNDKLRPRSFLARSARVDVARVESRTFICCESSEDAGPTNNWREPQEMKAHLRNLFEGCMRGRTCYVIIFCMGPLHSPLARFGVQITDSAYVVVNMRLMTRMGLSIYNDLQAHPNRPFTKGWHSVGSPLVDGAQDTPWPCNPDKLCIAHFPQDLEIMSFGSGYGGNALLGKKCLALRIASVMAKQEGWLAEHMLIMGVSDPEGHKHYIAAAFPSGCGKTNLAMLQPALPGWKIECVGDDIGWMWVDDEGQLRAINPEFGFFGIAPGTSDKTNATAMQTITHDTIFTNVALTQSGDVWWEGLPLPKEDIIDWQGELWNPLEFDQKAAHPNARFTVNIRQCPIVDPAFNDPCGVPISAIIFGARRAGVMPLALQSHDWTHGVLLGASLSSEMTAAAEGSLGMLRHDPFAMLPFCGYHMGDYFTHWLEVGKTLRKPVPIFYVNWFRKRENQYLWPGFGENIRIIKWILSRVRGEVEGQITPMGILPRPCELSTAGLSLRQEDLDLLTSINYKECLEECLKLKEYFKLFNKKLPKEFTQKLSEIEKQLNNDPLHSLDLRKL